MSWAKGVFTGPAPKESNDNNNNTTRPNMLFDIPDMDDDESKDIVKRIVKLESESRKFDKNPEKQMETQYEELKQLEKLKLRVMQQQNTQKKQDALQNIQKKLKQTQKQRAVVAIKRIRILGRQKKLDEIHKIVKDVVSDLPDAQSDDSNDEYVNAKDDLELLAEEGKKRTQEDAQVYFDNIITTTKKPKVLLEEVPIEKPEERKVITTDPIVLEFHRELTDIVQRATIPLVNFAGMVAKIVRVDYASRLLASKEERSHFVELGVDVEDFFDKNRDLGVNLLNLFMTGIEEGLQKQTESQFAPMGGDIHPCFDLDDLEDVTTRTVDQTLLGEIETLRKTIKRLMDNNQPAEDQIKQLQIATTKQSIQNARIKLIGGDLEHRFAPAWAFEVMGSAVFRKVLAGTTLGAFETAFAEVRRIPNCRNFTMKELICSPEVHDKFAYLVAFSWLSSGDDTSQQVGGGGKKDRSYQNNQYLNILKMREQLKDEITMTKIFFEVSVRRGKSKVKRAFEEAFERRKAQKLNDLSPVGYVKWEERMNLYLSQMPEYELFYSE